MSDRIDDEAFQLALATYIDTFGDFNPFDPGQPSWRKCNACVIDATALMAQACSQVAARLSCTIRIKRPTTISSKGLMKWSLSKQTSALWFTNPVFEGATASTAVDHRKIPVLLPIPQSRSRVLTFHRNSSWNGKAHGHDGDHDVVGDRPPAVIGVPCACGADGLIFFWRI